MKIAGVILAGGQSRRMGGHEKSLLKLADQEPITWVAQRFAPQVQILAVNANGEPERFGFLKQTVIADTVSGTVGPLAGVLSAMRWAKALPGITHLATAATDTPFLPKTFVHQLRETISGDNDIAMAASNGRIHPVFAVWPLQLADELEAFLVQENKRKILEFANRYTLHEIDFQCAPHDPFFNINTPEDLTIAEEIARELSQ